MARAYTGIHNNVKKPANKDIAKTGNGSGEKGHASQSTKKKKTKIKPIKPKKDKEAKLAVKRQPMTTKKKIGVAILLFLIAATLACFGVFLYIYYSDSKTEELWKDVSVVSGFDEEDDETVTDEEDDEKNAAMKRNVLFDDLWKINKDIIAWIYIPHTNIDYPILRERKVDQYYYLHHNIYKEYDANGSIFTDKIPKGLEEMHMILYGHHMNSGAMFGNLRDEFYYKSGYDKHKYIYIYWPDRTEKWDVWSAYDTDVYDYIYDIPFERGTKVYTKLINHIDKRKNYSTNRKLKNITNLDHTMTLSTCRGPAGGDLRFTVSCTLNSVKWFDKLSKEEYERKEQEKNQKVTATPTPKPMTAPSSMQYPNDGNDLQESQLQNNNHVVINTPPPEKTIAPMVDTKVKNRSG